MTATRELVYGRNAVRELYRGPRAGARDLGHGARRFADPVARLGPASAGQARAAALRGGGHARPPGRRRLVRAVPLRRRLRARRGPSAPLLVCLDQVTDPHNLGAVVRSAEAVGATGVVVPAHGSARVTPRGLPRIGRGGRASAGGRRPEPRSLPRGRQAARPVGVRRRRRGDGRDVGRRPHGRRRARARRRGQGGAASRPPHVRRDRIRSRSPARSVRSTSRSLLPCSCTRPVASAPPAMADPTLYLFDGYNLLHAGAFVDRDELIDMLASFVAGRGVRGVVVFDGAGEERAIGPLRSASRLHADDVLERLAAENRTSELVCVVSSDHAVRWTSGQEVRKLASQRVPRRAPAGRAHRTRAAGRRRPGRRPARPRDARAARASATRGVETRKHPVRAAATGVLPGSPTPAAAPARADRSCSSRGKPLEPVGQVPVPASEQLHRRGEQDCPDDRRVDQDRGGEPDSHLLHVDDRHEGEDAEHEHHHDRGARDDTGRRLDPACDRVLRRRDRGRSTRGRGSG